MSVAAVASVEEEYTDEADEEVVEDAVDIGGVVE